MAIAKNNNSLIFKTLKSSLLLLTPILSIAAFAQTVPVHPYWDQGSNVVDLSGLNSNGIYPVVAFVTAKSDATSGGCGPALAGAISAPLNPSQFYALSFGGANGDYVNSCVVSKATAGLDPMQNMNLVARDGGKLAQLMDTFLSNKKIFSSVPVSLDFDIEHDQSSYENFVRFYALALLQQKYPNLKVTYTLATLPNGLNASGDGQGLLKDFNNFLSVKSLPVDAGQTVVTGKTSFSNTGKWFAGINLMTMDFGALTSDVLPANQPNPQIGFNSGMTMADASLAAVKSVYAQATASALPNVATLFTSGQSKISVTPMIGQNDNRNEQFYLADATKLAQQFATLPYAGDIRYWSLERDRSCKAPFLLGSVNVGPAQGKGTYCSTELQSVQASPSSGGSFYQAFSQQQGYNNYSGSNATGIQSVTLSQLMNGGQYTPYYYANITLAPSSSEQYVTVYAKPIGINSAYNSDYYKGILASIPECKFLTQPTPSGGYKNMFTSVYDISGSATSFNTKDDANFKLCPFTDYAFNYYYQPINGEWTHSTGADTTVKGSQLPKNKITKTNYAGPISGYNTAGDNSSGVFFYINAVPDWGRVQGLLEYAGKMINFNAGQFITFLENPTGGESYKLSVAIPPNKDNYTIVRQGTLQTVQPNKTTLMFAVTKKLYTIGHDIANLAFVGAPTTPQAAELSSASRVGFGVILNWGHIATELAKTDGASQSFTVTVTNADTGATVYQQAGVKDDKSVNENSLSIPIGTGPNQIPWGHKYDYEIKAVVPNASWYWKNGDVFTGTFELPVNITGQFQPMYGGNTYPTEVKDDSPNGFDYQIGYEVPSSASPIPWAPDTEMVFNIPFTESVYGQDQYAAHDCGDPTGRANKNGFVTGTSVVGKEQSGMVSATSTYVEQNGQAYCKTDIKFKQPDGVYSFKPGDQWISTFTVKSSGDSSHQSDATAIQKAINDSILIVQPYGQDQLSCNINLQIPNRSGISGFPQASDPAPGGNISFVIPLKDKGASVSYNYDKSNSCMPQRFLSSFSSSAIHSSDGVSGTIDGSTSAVINYVGLNGSCGDGDATKSFFTNQFKLTVKAASGDTAVCKVTTDTRNAAAY